MIQVLKRPRAPRAQVWFAEYASPVGTLIAAGSAEALLRLAVRKPLDGFLEGIDAEYGVAPRHSPERFAILFKELDEYFAARPVDFSARVAPEGTPFELKVWEVLQKIPRGRTLSYKDVARMTGSPGAARAVGGACSKNPIPVIIPCHRVLNADGGLGGYTGGLDIKKTLLKIEGLRLFSL